MIDPKGVQTPQVGWLIDFNALDVSKAALGRCRARLPTFLCGAQDGHAAD